MMIYSCAHMATLSVKGLNLGLQLGADVSWVRSERWGRCYCFRSLEPVGCRRLGEWRRRRAAETSRLSDGFATTRSRIPTSNCR